MKIKTKLLSSFSLLILLSIVLGLLSYKTINNLSSKINPAIELNNAISMHMLQLRKNEILSEIDSLDQYSSNEEYHAKMAEMKILVSDYRTQFLVVAEKKKERGFKNWGKIGALRKSVHNIEERLEGSIGAVNRYQLISTMLMCRRHEKDYLLRNDPKYKQILHDRVDLFVEQVKQSGLEERDQSQLIILIMDYRTKFNQVVEIDEEIGRTPSYGLMGNYRSTIQKLEPLVETQDKILKEEMNNLVQRSTIILLSLIGLITIFGFGLAFILSAKITRPLINMTKAGKKISAGDLSAQIPNINTNDEVKEMGETMDLLIGAIKFHLNKA